MTDEIFWLTFAGLGISLAGFAGLIHALDRSGDADNPITKWRIRNIVAGGVGIALSGLFVWPVFRLTEDVELTVRITSIFLLLQFFPQMRSMFQPGPEWPDESRRRVVLGSSIVMSLLVASNVVIGSVGFLELLFLLAVAVPIGIFVRAIGDLHHGANGRVHRLM